MGIMIFAVFLVITLGTFFQFGYHNGVINQPLELITQFIENVTIERHGEIDGTPLTLLTSLCVSTYLIGGLFGSLLGGILSNKLGRRTSIIILSVPCVVGSVLLMLCKWAHSFEMIIIGRLIVGLACGAFTAVGPAYLYEVSPHTVRGAAGSLNQLVCVFSLLLSQLLGLKQAMKTEQLWPLLLGLNAVPCVLTAVCLLFIPESPRFLYIVRNDVESAKAAFFKIGRSPEQVEFELDEMLRELETSQHKVICSASNVFFSDIVANLLPYSTFTVGAFSCASLSSRTTVFGIEWFVIIYHADAHEQASSFTSQFITLTCSSFACCTTYQLLYYSGTLFTQNGLTTEQATYATIGLGLALFFSSLVSTLVMDRLGRRVLMIGGLLISFFSLIVFTVCLIIHDSIGAQWPVYIAVAATYVFVIGFGIGPDVGVMINSYLYSTTGVFQFLE
ncbi:Solute carrier family 2 facilitated glucose transporter member 14 [Fasciola gigantica]|uniref:Solute carrier family 2 facilitated glucose transporter member 14 n=1 Tax=Fasciola gigantica TaxID=46835 RepID=A0A504YAU9_FASGI|nr:Solute carrier family 2 facilitated glucose transporter member 14 [Fasciola gigantica]